MMSKLLTVFIVLFFCLVVLLYLSTKGIWPRNDSIPSANYVKWRNRFFWSLFTAFVIYASKLRLEEDWDLKHRIAMPILAEPYAWPDGCVEKQYNDNDVISIKCKNDKYYMGSDRKYYWKDRPEYGLSYSTRSRYYYRIGNDAGQILCFSFNFSELEFDKCKIFSISRDVFKVSAND